MNSELIWVLSMLVGAILLFITNKVRMDVVALLIIILFVLSGTLTLPQALAGFSDPNVILIAALFVVGEGLVRTGIAYQVVPVRQYFAYGLPCRDYTAKAKIGGRNQRIHGTACQQPDGSWRIDGCVLERSNEQAT